MKKIPSKNYIILCVLIVATIVSTFYVRSWYITNKEYYSRNSVIKDIIREINVDEIGNYTLESPRFMLYVSSGANAEVKEFENGFKKLIKKLEISEDILYLNIDNVNYDLYSNLRNFAVNEKISSLIFESKASLYIFSDGKIVGVLNDVDNFSDKQIQSFIKKWGFING